jgi:hypothetical protein
MPNVQAVDAREVPCCGVIKDLQVCLLATPKKMLVMDVLVIDVLHSGVCSFETVGQM